MKRLLTYSIILFLLACGQAIDNNKPSGLFPIKEFGKWGYINSYGQTVIKCQFDEVGQFSEGLAAILIDTVWGFIDTTGKIVIEPKYYMASLFSEGLSNVIIQKDTSFQNAFIRTDGTIAFLTEHEYVGSFYNGKAEVEIDNEICYFNKKGEIAINTHYPYSEGRFHEGIVKVWTGDSSKYIDTTGKTIAIFQGISNENFSEGLAKISLNGESFYIDNLGKKKITPQNSTLTFFSFSDGMAKVTISGSDHKTGFIDITGKIVIPIQYHDIRGFTEGVAAFEENNVWGFIDKTGKVVIKPQFEQIEYEGFSNGLCRAKQNHQWGYINKKGEFVWKEQVGIEYSKLDLSKWNLDTLETNNALFAGKNAVSDNFPRKQIFTSLNQLTLKVDTVDLTVFADKYFAHKLYLINASKDTFKIPAQDGRIKIIQQAKNKKGEWQDIEYFMNSFCGNSYHTLRLTPNQFQIFATPIFKGDFNTQLRFKLKIDKQIIYSNIYTGQINISQLLNPKNNEES